MGSAVLDIIIDVEVAGSGPEPKVSVTVRFLDLPNFFKRRFISFNSGWWCSLGRDDGGEKKDALDYISVRLCGFQIPTDLLEFSKSPVSPLASNFFTPYTDRLTVAVVLSVPGNVALPNKDTGWILGPLSILLVWILRPLVMACRQMKPMNMPRITTEVRHQMDREKDIDCRQTGLIFDVYVRATSVRFKGWSEWPQSHCHGITRARPLFSQVAVILVLL